MNRTFRLSLGRIAGGARSYKAQLCLLVALIIAMVSCDVTGLTYPRKANLVDDDIVVKFYEDIGCVKGVFLATTASSTPDAVLDSLVSTTFKDLSAVDGSNLELTSSLTAQIIRGSLPDEDCAFLIPKEARSSWSEERSRGWLYVTLTDLPENLQGRISRGEVFIIAVMEHNFGGHTFEFVALPIAVK